MKFWK